MARTLAFLALAIATGAGSATAEVFRCVEANGSVRFVGSPNACADGEADSHSLPALIESAPAVPAAPDAAATRSGAAVWPSESELAGEWEAVREAPVDTSGDPDLVEWGVRGQDVRHYTRDVEGSVQVCSIEVWTFADVARARTAQQGFRHPGWRIEQAGDHVVMVRGLTLTRGDAPQRGIFADCQRLGDRVLARAGARDASTPPAPGGGPVTP